jgi:C-terminal processing protease CtpA/Prc
MSRPARRSRVCPIVGVASQFLDSGNVLLNQDSQGAVTEVPVKDGGLALDTPLVVLVNQGAGGDCLR